MNKIVTNFIRTSHSITTNQRNEVELCGSIPNLILIFLGTLLMMGYFLSDVLIKIQDQ